MPVSVKEQCIADFGEQWQRYRENDGFYGSRDLFEELMKTDDKATLLLLNGFLARLSATDR